MFKIIVAPDGSVRMINTEETQSFIALGEGQTKRRASHVEPAGFFKRQAFRLIRKIFGEDGHMGQWTRGWRCLWSVDLRPSGGQAGMKFMDRDRAIAYEVRWLNENNLGRRENKCLQSDSDRIL